MFLLITRMLYYHVNYKVTFCWCNFRSGAILYTVMQKGEDKKHPR